MDRYKNYGDSLPYFSLFKSSSSSAFFFLPPVQGEGDPECSSGKCLSLPVCQCYDSRRAYLFSTVAVTHDH